MSSHQPKHRGRPPLNKATNQKGAADGDEKAAVISKFVSDDASPCDSLEEPVKSNGSNGSKEDFEDKRYTVAQLRAMVAESITEAQLKYYQIVAAAL